MLPAFIPKIWDVARESKKFPTPDLDNEPKQDTWTKWNLTQVLASVFDPLRLILPFLVHSKVIIQEVWKLKVNWDEIIPE